MGGCCSLLPAHACSLSGIYAHTHVHDTHKHTHTHTHTCTQGIYSFARLQACCWRTNGSHTCARAHTHTRTHTHAHNHTHTLSNTHIYTHTHTHTRTHTKTRTRNIQFCLSASALLVHEPPEFSKYYRATPFQKHNLPKTWSRELTILQMCELAAGARTGTALEVYSYSQARY